MPVVGQIIPPYLQPHVHTVINDNTEFDDQAARVVDDNVKMFYVISSRKGRDNVFLTHKDEYSWIDEYGTPNMSLYGQAGYMAYASLSTGNCTVKTMRVMPDDATYSNVLISLKVRKEFDDVVGGGPSINVPGAPGVVPQPPVVDGEPGNDGDGSGDIDDNPDEDVNVVRDIFGRYVRGGRSKGKITVKHECSFIDNARTVDDLEIALESLRNEEPDAEGYITLPLCAFYSTGRGVYGDEFRVRVGTSAQLDRDNDFKNCKIEVIGTEKGFTSLGFYEGALFADALSGKRSLYIADILNDLNSGSDHVNMIMDASTVTYMAELYKTEIDPDTEIDEKTIDVFSFLDKKSKPLKNIEWDPNTVALDMVSGIPLTGGSDGSFAEEDPLKRKEKIDDVLVKAFKGEIEPAIKSRRRIPSDVMLDCGYSAEVKRALLDLANTRKASMLYLDAGLITTKLEAINWAEEMINLSPYLLSKNVGCYRVRDPFTHRPMTVTITYLFATAIPMHFKVKGKHVPFAAANVKLTGHLQNSFKPEIDADEKDIKEQLYEKRVNFFESVSETVYQRGSQTTAQLIWSDLSEEHNVHELFDIKRVAEDYAASKIYNFAEVEDRQMFTEDMKTIFLPRIGNTVRSFDVSFEMNSWEETRSILHCYISIVFKTIAKRVIVEIDVNPRV